MSKKPRSCPWHILSRELDSQDCLSRLLGVGREEKLRDYTALAATTAKQRFLISKRDFGCP